MPKQHDSIARGLHTANKNDTGAPSYDELRVDPKVTPAEPAYLSPEVCIALQRQKLENFNREWPLIPRELQRRIKELERYPTAPNLSYLFGILTGYGMATGNPSMSYAGALAQALVGKDRDRMLSDEVRHAPFSV